MEASSVLDFKSTTLYAIRVVLHSADMAAIIEALDRRMQDAAGFFDDEPVVIDASRLEQDIDWPRLVGALAAHKLPAIGAMARGALLESARAAGLAEVALPAAPGRPAEAGTNEGQPPAAATPDGEAAAPAGASGNTGADAAAEPKTDAAVQPAKTAAAADRTPAADIALDQPPAASPTLIVDRPLRSGQRIYARHADLIVLGIVSPGAEVIADGNVHVYGPLRGRAIAGARGDTGARIFATQFDAELVAVAGVYRSITAASPDLQNRPATVRLDGEKLLVESLAI
ncbi:septum site-determining protein MinC [Pigmentiphaga soli]|uniref:Probable septum site-determining protein MinC n=1 Tax=Pigmentiphaga soli TaxID=1007095 RepID=A0ABP8GNK1_9BURK